MIAIRPVWLAALLLMATAALPWQTRWLVDLAVIIVLGVPHGALDGEIARTMLRPRVGGWWFVVFALPYMALFACVLIAWRVAPAATLGGFLAASVWHFGTEDSRSGAWDDILACGGLPIALPLLVHPDDTWRVFATVARLAGAAPWWLTACAWLWAGLAVVWVARRDDWAALRGPAVMAAGFVVLPPLAAFAIYFVCVHAPAHVAAVIADRRRAPRVTDQVSAARLALPITALTVLIGASLWPLYGGVPAERLLALTVQVLAALTLPHMVLELVVEGRSSFLKRGSKKLFDLGARLSLPAR